MIMRVLLQIIYGEEIFPMNGQACSCVFDGAQFQKLLFAIEGLKSTGFQWDQGA